MSGHAAPHRYKRSTNEARLITRYNLGDYFGRYSCTLLATLVCFVHVRVAAQTALTMSNYSDIRSEKQTNAYVCSFMQRVMWLLFWIQVRNSLAFVGLMQPCVVCLVVVCLFVCHPDRYACRHSYIFTIHKRTQSKIREANARVYSYSNTPLTEIKRFSYLDLLHDEQRTQNHMRAQ